jgi:transposase
VNPRNTSQLCSRCGVAVKKNLRVRVHVCPHCGLILDRDVNAARNVLAFALNPHHSWGLNPARTERSEPNVDQWVVRALRSRCLQATE